jgi:DNA-binding MarR family transcriptional regulator
MQPSFLARKNLAGKNLPEKYPSSVTSLPPDHIDGILQQWQRERPDLDSSPIGLFGRLFRAADLADAALAEGLAAYELQSGWFDLLAALRRAGAPYALNPTHLMRATMLSSGGMTKRIDRLMDAGLVERAPDPADRRGVLVRLTRRGKRTIDGALGAHLANEERLLRSLTPTDRTALERLLRTLLAELEQPQPAAPTR